MSDDSFVFDEDGGIEIRLSGRRWLNIVTPAPLNAVVDLSAEIDAGTRCEWCGMPFDEADARAPLDLDIDPATGAVATGARRHTPKCPPNAWVPTP